MPSIGSSLQTLVERVANRYGMLESFTTTATNGGTTTTAVSLGLWLPNDSYIGKWLYVSATNGSAAPYNEERQIIQSVQASKSVTVSHAFSAAVPNSATVQTYARWPRAKIVNAINRAVRASGGYWWQDVVDESLTLTSGDYSISLSTLNAAVQPQFGLHRVGWQTNTSESTYPYQDIADWRLRFSGTTPTLEFGYRTYTGGRTLRLEYRANPSTMTLPTDQTGVDDDWFDTFIEEYALFQLWQSRSAGAPVNDKGPDRQLSQAHYNVANDVRRMHAMRQPSNKVRSNNTRSRLGRDYFGSFSP